MKLLGIYLVAGATMWEFQVWRLGLSVCHLRFWRPMLRKHWLTGKRQSPIRFHYFGPDYDAGEL